jgi:hypothetical protein
MDGLGYAAFETADRVSQFRFRLFHFMQAARKIFQPYED